MERVNHLIDKLADARDKKLGTEVLLLIAGMLVKELKETQQTRSSNLVSVIMPKKETVGSIWIPSFPSISGKPLEAR